MIRAQPAVTVPQGLINNLDLSTNRLGSKARKLKDALDENRLLKEQISQLSAALQMLSQAQTQPVDASEGMNQLESDSDNETDGSKSAGSKRSRKNPQRRREQRLRRKLRGRVGTDSMPKDTLEVSVGAGAAEEPTPAGAAVETSAAAEAARVASEGGDEDVARLKMKVWEVLNRERDEDLVPVELQLAPRSMPDHIMDKIPQNRTSFNIVDLGTVVDKFLLWKRKLPRAEPFYAVKSNPDVAISHTLHTLGSGFDCASRAEMKQVLDLGADPSNIIFANPCKPIEHIIYAKENGIEMMTFDNMEELHKIHAVYPEAKIVLRLLPDDSFSLMPFGLKFGATFEDAVRLMTECKELGMNLIGCSFHVGSGCFSPVGWVEALKLARRVFDEASSSFGYEFTFLDLGGGWPGHENGELKFANIGDEITPLIDELFPEHIRVIGEPGRFICCQTTSLAVTVVSKRERVIAGAVGQESDKEVQYYVSDGVYGSFNCIMFDHAHPEPAFLFDVSERKVQPSTMFGPTCDSMDCIFKKLPMPDHNVGEWLYFPHMGAYTGAAASAFNGFAPPRSYYIMSTW